MVKVKDLRIVKFGAGQTLLRLPEWDVFNPCPYTLYLRCWGTRNEMEGCHPIIPVAPPNGHKWEYLTKSSEWNAKTGVMQCKRCNQLIMMRIIAVGNIWESIWKNYYNIEDIRDCEEARMEEALR